MITPDTQEVIMRFVMLPGDEQEKSAGHVVEHFLCLGSKAIAEEKPRTCRTKKKYAGDVRRRGLVVWCTCDIASR